MLLGSVRTRHPTTARIGRGLGSGDTPFRRTSLTRPNGVNTAYTYEPGSDLSQINTAWAASAGQTPAIYGFQHDAAGRIIGLDINRPDLEWAPSPASGWSSTKT